MKYQTIIYFYKKYSKIKKNQQIMSKKFMKKVKIIYIEN